MDSKDRLNLRIKDLVALREVYDKQRDKLLDQFMFLKGFLGETEKIIIELTQKIDQIIKEENDFSIKEKQSLEKQKKEEEMRVALEQARQAGNIGTHPSQRESIRSRKLKYLEEKKKIEEVEEQTILFSDSDLLNIPTPQEEIEVVKTKKKRVKKTKIEAPEVQSEKKTEEKDNSVKNTKKTKAKKLEPKLNILKTPHRKKSIKNS